MPTISSRGARAFGRTLPLLLLFALATALGTQPAAAQTLLDDHVSLDRGRLTFGLAPVIDGNGDDLIAFAAAVGATDCAIDRADARDDIAVADPKIDPCAPLEDTDGNAVADYFVNGKDLRRFVLVYDRAASDLYLLWRAEGVIGDLDGNGNPDNNLCVPPANFPDQFGIGSEDTYEARLDIDCDGSSDIIVRIEGEQIVVIGAAAGAGSFAYRAGPGTGRDLEAVIPGISLPPVFSAFAFSGAIRDGLGEDVTASTLCGNPAPSINLEKTVAPAVVCAGGTADFTLTVTNTGNVALAGVVVTDQLPAGLTFQQVAANSCGGAVGGAGGTITVGPFDLAPGASCVLVIRVGRTAECAGEQVNVASVEGSFQSPCFNGGDPVVVVDQASATLLCGNAVCSITASANAVCAGQTAQLCGPLGNFGYQWSNGATTRCINVGPGTYSLVVTDLASGCTSTNNCQVTIGEKSAPCVSVVANGPATACPGDAIQICGTVTNCGDRPADLQVRLGAQSQSFPGVPAGEGRPYCFAVVMPDCAPDGADFTVVATSTNDCGTDTAEDTHRVLCGECERCLGVLILDEETIDNDIRSIENAARACPLTPDRLVNDDRPREVGNLPLRWNTVCPGGIVTLPSGQLFDEGVFALPETLPWSLEAFVAGTVPQSQLDKIANVNPLQTPELQQLEGCSFVAVVYDSDISMNYGPTNGNLQGGRLGLFFFTVLDVIPPGTLPESGSSSSQWDLVIRVDPVPADYCVAHPFGEGQCAAGDAAGTASTHELPAPIVEGTTAMELYKASPNPFSSGTQFAFEVTAPGGAEVSVAVYDAAGRRVRGLAAGVHASGRHVAAWDGRTEAGSLAPRGVYFVRTLIGGEKMPVQRVLFVR